MAIHGYKGGVISATAPTVSPSSASGVWTLDEQLQNSAEWPITNTLLNDSVRIRASATAYLSRTFPTAGNRRTWTWSGWVKRGTIGTAYERIFGGPANASHIYFVSDYLQFDLSDVASGTAIGAIKSSAVYRDPSAWYHIVAVCDTTQATASNRMKLYVNGTQITALSQSDYPSQNYQGAINAAGQHTLGYRTATQGTAGIPFDGYMADINFIDGQALTPNYFGATNPNTGVWQPAQFHGTYGTNGFYLPMNIEQLQVTFSNSLRFRASNSAYLSRTPSTASNRRTFTYSAWVKRGTITSDRELISAGSGSALYCGYRFTNSEKLDVCLDDSNYRLRTTQVFRDPSSWYHIVIAIDTTQSTSSNRVKVYVNGSQVTAFDTALYPTQNYDTQFNSTTAHNIGRRTEDSAAYFDGYMTNINFIDGLALEPNLFGTVDATSGAWVPVTYAGSYGTNGFFLPFTNATSTTTLGYDFSGLGNNWTANNISVTAGVTYDSMTDVPTLTSETASNFCTLNSVAKTYANGTKSAGNLDFVGDGTNYCQALGTIATPLSGKYYWEVTATVGVGSAERRLVGLWSTNNFNFSLDTPQESTQGALHYYALDGDIAINDPFPFADYGASWTTGDVIGVAVNIDTNQVTFYKNNVSQGAVSLPSNMQGVPLYPSGISLYSNSGLSFNFGQRPFAYTPPTGFVALNTYNM
jgi:hypothetical protein